MNENLMHFMIGSSVFITIFPTVYLYNIWSEIKPTQEKLLPISIPTLMCITPIIFGCLHAIIYCLVSPIIPRKASEDLYLRFCLSGSFAGIIISAMLYILIGDFNLPIMMQNPLLFNLGVGVFYFILYFSIGTWLRTQIIYGSTSAFMESISPSKTVYSPRIRNGINPNSYQKVYSPKDGRTPPRLSLRNTRSDKFDELARSLQD